MFVSQRLTMLASKERGEDFDALREFIEGEKVMPVIDRTYSLSEAAEAIRVRGGGKRPWKGRYRCLISGSPASR
jgi:NADPH:quinone reductase-like Zn-dependent oxidoreductase